ncbi:MAG: Trm112 family protein [Acidimicrobiia bacterium]
MALDARLLEILACPDDKGPLLYFADDAFLFCPHCRRRYEVTDDIPVMLLDEASALSEGDADALVERAAASGITPTFTPGDHPEPPGGP